MFLELADVATHLIALSLIQGLIAWRWSGTLIGQVLSGLLFGIICVSGMSNPIEIAAGTLFVSCTIILSMAGLFGGPLVAGIAITTAIGYSTWLGGSSMPLGIASMITSTLLGLAFHYSDLAMAAMKDIAIPMVIIFTPATVLLGILLKSFEEQVRTKNALIASDQRLRMFAKTFQASPTPSSICRLNEGSFYDVNEAWMSATGYTREEALGHSALELGIWGDPDRQEQFVELLKNDGTVSNFETKFRNKKGEERDFLVSVERVDFGHEPMLFSVSHDITALKNSEIMNLRLARIVEDSINEVYVFDAETLEFMQVNASACENLGYTQEELLGLTPLDLKPEYSHDKFFELIAPLRSGEKDRIQFKTVHIEDITLRKMAEEALRESENQLREILENSPVGVAVVTHSNDDGRPTGNRLFVNSSLMRMFGASSRGQLLKADISESWVDRDQLNTVEKIMSRRGELVDFEVLRRRMDGTEFWVSMNSRPILFNGTDCSMVWHFDMTKRKKAEEQLRQAQKMEAIGQLTGGIAHDFNNLLAVILGNIQLLEKSIGGDERGRQQLRFAADAARRGSQLVERMLAFSRKQKLDLKIIDADDLLINIRGMLSRTLGERIKFRITGNKNLWLTKVDPSQLELAVLNLTINARDAMPEGGMLTIDTENVHLDEDSHSVDSELSAGDYVSITVTDTGKGIPADILGQVIEPFFTTKGIGQGSGLGLSMVYGFARQSGGGVEVVSEIGQGTMVKLYLPRNAAKKADALTVVANAGNLVGGSEKILVVEDDPAVCRVAVSLLEELGYRVLKANDGPSAIQVLKDEQVDLLFSDIIMPGGLRGDELATLAVKSYPELKVLHCSGYGLPRNLHDGIAIPEHAMLKKPYQIEDLATSVRQALDA